MGERLFFLEGSSAHRVGSRDCVRKNSKKIFTRGDREAHFPKDQDSHLIERKTDGGRK